MTVQAGAAETLLARDPGRALEPVQAVQKIGRDALVEMKRLVGILRDGDESSLAPQPGLSQLDGLLAEVRDAGLEAELRTVGEPRPLPSAVELSADGIVQEALTNVLEHARCRRVGVEIRYLGESVELETSTTAPAGASAHAAEATG
jgi:signal transduction histidine kinase